MSQTTSNSASGDAKEKAISGELPQKYKPSEHEDRVWDKWVAAGSFHAEPQRVLDGTAEPYCIFIPPPNVTAALHLGHALNNTIQDILIRAKRMQGFETLWMAGTDHAGIATQAVVEKRVMKEEKKRRTDYSREDFVAKIQAFKDEYEATITNQLKKMGCSCDWDRQRFTMDEQCAAAVREAFFILFRDGLIYRGKRLVNWDPVLQTAVADDECYDEEIDGNFYYLRYPLVHALALEPGTPHAGFGKGHTHDVAPRPVTWDELVARGYPGAESHPSDQQAWLTVATTRPETYLGDTAVAINPHDPRAKALRGMFAELPLVGRVIPIIEDSYVVLPERFARDEEEKNDPKAKMATGFLKVTPAHDPNDYDIGQRHALAMINIFSPDGRISDKHSWTDVGDAHLLVGLPREKARAKVVEEFKARDLFEGSKPTRHSVKHSDRSKAIIEPYLSDQWYVRTSHPRLSKAANDALELRRDDSTNSKPDPLCDASRDYWRIDVGNRSFYFDHPKILEGESGIYRPIGGFHYRIDLSYAKLTDAERSEIIAGYSRLQSETAKLLCAVIVNDVLEHVGFGPAGQIAPPLPEAVSKRMQGVDWFKEAHWMPTSLSDIQAVADTIRTTILKPQMSGATRDWQTYPFLYLNVAQPDFRPTNVHVTFAPDRYTNIFRNWNAHQRDWCISRQLWWGHRIPVWRKLVTTIAHSDGLNLTDLDSRVGVPTIIENLRAYRQPEFNTDLNQFLCSQKWTDNSTGNRYELICMRQCDSRVESEIRRVLTQLGFTEDPDVLDTWFSSALWPLSTLGWPDPTKFNPALNKGLLEAFNPSQTLCTAREIITLWVSRMVMFNGYLKALGTGHQALAKTAGAPIASASAQSPVPSASIPFHHVFIHAVIQDGEGRKMSKSLGNGVDPLDIIATHGADAMRFTLCHMATNTQDVRLPVKKDANGNNTSEKFDLGRNFATKLWNAARFALSMIGSPSGTSLGNPTLRMGSGGAPDTPSATGRSPHAERGGTQAGTQLLDRWMLSRLAAGSQLANDALANYEFHEYAQALYDLLWRDFCDWYLEGVKPTIASNPAQQAVLGNVLGAIVRMLHPVMPYVTETLWEHMGKLRLPAVAGVTLVHTKTDAINKKREATGLLVHQAWPAIASSLRDEKSEAQFDRLRALVTAIRDVRAAHQVKPSARIALQVPKQLSEFVMHADIKPLLMTFAGLESVDVRESAGPDAGPTEGVAFTFESVEFFVPGIGGSKETESARVAKQIAELEKSVTTLEGRLNNPGYTDRAPPHMVQQTRDELTKKKQELDAARAAMAKLG